MLTSHNEIFQGGLNPQTLCMVCSIVKLKKLNQVGDFFYYHNYQVKIRVRRVMQVNYNSLFADISAHLSLNHINKYSCKRATLLSSW